MKSPKKFPCTFSCIAANFLGHSSNSLVSEITSGSRKLMLRRSATYVGTLQWRWAAGPRSTTASNTVPLKDKFTVNIDRLTSATFPGSKYQLKTHKVSVKIKKCMSSRWLANLAAVSFIHKEAEDKSVRSYFPKLLWKTIEDQEEEEATTSCKQWLIICFIRTD